MRFAFPQWKGFEVAPEGHLLDQLVDLSGPMGIVHERSVSFHKDFHRHDRAMIVVPRGSCVMRVKTAGARGVHDVDHASVLIVPQGLEHDDEGLTAIFETLVLFPSAPLLDRVAEDEGIAVSQVRRFFGRCRTLPRSRWLEQLLQEYFFARVVSRRESAQTRAFFERQILVELLAVALGRRKRAEPDRAAGDGENAGPCATSNPISSRRCPWRRSPVTPSPVSRRCSDNSAGTPEPARTPTSRPGG